MGARMFFFPDEKNPIQDTMKPIPQVTHELGDVTYRSSKSSDTDDEFCFIGDDAGLGVIVRFLILKSDNYYFYKCNFFCYCSPKMGFQRCVGWRMKV